MDAVLGASGVLIYQRLTEGNAITFRRYYERFDRTPEYPDYTPRRNKRNFVEDIFKESESILDRLKALQQENAELNETIKLMDVEITG